MSWGRRLTKAPLAATSPAASAPSSRRPGCRTRWCLGDELEEFDRILESAEAEDHCLRVLTDVLDQHGKGDEAERLREQARQEEAGLDRLVSGLPCRADCAYEVVLVAVTSVSVVPS